MFGSRIPLYNLQKQPVHPAPIIILEEAPLDFAMKKSNNIFGNKNNCDFGICAGQKNESEEIKRKRKQLETEAYKKFDCLNERQKEMVQEKFECPICCCRVDLYTNLQWLLWGNIYWFSCLFESLEKERKWPICRQKVGRDDLFSNNRLLEMFDLIVSVGKEREVFWKSHDQRCDLFWKVCKTGVWSKCILENGHFMHELFLVNDVIQEVFDKCAQSNNSKGYLIENIKKEIRKINYSKLIQCKIERNLLEPFKSFSSTIENEYNTKIEKTYLYVDKVLKESIIKSENNEEIIKRFSEYKYKENLLDTVNALDSQEEIGKTLPIILNDFEKLWTNEKLCVFESPVHEKYFVEMNKVIKDQELKINLSSEETSKWTVTLSNSENKSFNLIIDQKEVADLNYFMIVNTKEQAFGILQDNQKAYKLKANSQCEVIIKLLIDFSKVKPEDTLEVEVLLWKDTKEITDYIAYRKDIIKAEFQKVIDSL